MAARNKPYESYGPYILFKKLESDSLGDLWRAERIDVAPDGTAQHGPTLALRRLSGGSRPSLAANVEAVTGILPRIAGASFVRDQQAGIIDGVPYLAWDYASGRSLRYIVDRARGGKDAPPNPLPIDQAIVVAEKVALSLATTADLRDASGSRLCHGGLLPQFIWISDDGEIRTAGQQLGAGLIASLSDPKVGPEMARYFSPEYRSSGQPDKNTDVYSLGAVLFLLVTGQEPPDAATASAFGAAVRAAKTMAGAPIPDDIRVILDKSFNIDSSMRYASMADMKQALTTLVHGGKYSATTFNLAFYLSNLLKKEMESEAVEREKESKINVAPYLETPSNKASALESSAPMFIEAPKTKSKLPLFIGAAVVVVVAAAVGGYLMFGRSTAEPPPSSAPAATQTAAPPAPPPKVISEPIVASGNPNATTTGQTAAQTATSGSSDSEAEKRAFEEAVRRKLQAEMMKLQSDFMTELKQKQSKDAPVASAQTSAPPPTTTSAPSQPAATDSVLTAAQLDQQQKGQPTTTAAKAPPQPAQTQTAPAVQQAAAPPTPAPQPKPTVHVGDVIDVAELDVIPRPIRPIRPVYPPIAMRQKIRASIILSVLVSETGEVQDVKVLRGDSRFGLNDAAVRALREARFSIPIKDGKAVKTWYPQTIDFMPN